MDIQREQLPERDLTLETCGGQWFSLVQRAPETVCAPLSLLVCALRSVGVALHPGFPFQKFSDENGVFWRWMLADKSVDGIYQTADLVKWWNDEDWIAAHPTHEWRIVRSVLQNMAQQAREIRDSPTLCVIRRGKSEAHIPENATPEYRAHILAQIDGTLPLATPFTGPHTN